MNAHTLRGVAGVVLVVVVLAAVPGCAGPRVGTTAPDPHRPVAEPAVAMVTGSLTPDFPIGTAGAAVFRVRSPRGAGAVRFPHWLEIETRRHQPTSRPRTPFEDAVIRVRIVDPADGATIAETTVRPNAPRQFDVGRFETPVWTRRDAPKDLPTEYTLRVDVLHPSRRAWDRARIRLGSP